MRARSGCDGDVAWKPNMCGYAIATGVCVMLACFYVSPAKHVQTCL